MSSDNPKHMFRDGLDPDRDHSASLEDDWSVLERRLDKHDAGRRRILWVKRVGAVAAMLLVLLTWVLTRDKDLKVPANPVAKHGKTTGGQAGQTEQSPGNKAPESGSFTGGRTPAENGGQRPTGPQKSTPGAVSTGNGEAFAKQEPRGRREKKLTTEWTERRSLEYHGLLSQPVVAGDVKQLPLPEIRLAEVRAQGETYLAVENVDRRRGLKVPLSISVMYAPALNGINNYKEARVGSDYGLLVTLGLSKKWSLTTGAIYAKKLYESDFSSYNPANKASYPYIPERVYADCRVLDLPLNVSYTLINRGRNTVTVGTGVSSYLMLKEDYRFRYTQQSGVGDYDYSIRNKNKHAFSVINLDARYVRRINNKLGIGFQPYLKVPVADIGYGNVRLHSLGMAVNLNLSVGSRVEKK